LSRTRTKLHRNVWVTSATSFLTDVSSEMIFNLLPLFLANVLGVRTGAIGLVEGVAESVSSFLKIVSGFVSDLAGTRKWLAVLGYGVSAASKPFLYVASSWEAVLGVRAADRMGKGVRSAPRDALLAESVSASDRGLAFGLHRAFDSGGAFVGVLVATGVVWSVQRGALALEPRTFRLLVLASLVPSFAAVVVLAIGAKEVESRGRERKPAALPRLSLRGIDPSFRRFLLAMIVFTLGNSSDAFLVLRAQERGLSVVGILGMLLGFNLVYTLVAVPAGRLSDSLGRKVVITVGWVFYVLLYAGFAFAQTAWQVTLLFALYGLYYGMTEGGGRAFVADLVTDSETLGTAYGLYHAAVGAAALPASLIAGVLWQGLGEFPGYGPRAPFLFGAGLALVATLLLASIPGKAAVLSSGAKKGHP
jgi:MFS family permease